MSRRYQVLLHGSGFSVPTEDGDPIRGFYTSRRAMADTPRQAEERVIAALRQEEKFRWLANATEASGTSYSVRADSISEVSWFRWYFSKVPKGFAFYTDEDQS